jgi:hypothetical protein
MSIYCSSPALIKESIFLNQGCLNKKCQAKFFPLKEGETEQVGLSNQLGRSNTDTRSLAGILYNKLGYAQFFL